MLAPTARGRVCHKTEHILIEHIPVSAPINSEETWKYKQWVRMVEPPYTYMLIEGELSKDDPPPLYGNHGDYWYGRAVIESEVPKKE